MEPPISKVIFIQNKMNIFIYKSELLSFQNGTFNFAVQYFLSMNFIEYSFFGFRISFLVLFYFCKVKFNSYFFLFYEVLINSSHLKIKTYELSPSVII